LRFLLFSQSKQRKTARVQRAVALFFRSQNLPRPRISAENQAWLADNLAGETATQERSDPSRGEVDARVDQHVGQVADQFQEQADQCEDVERGEHNRVVAVDRRLEAEEAETVE